MSERKPISSGFDGLLTMGLGASAELGRNTGRVEAFIDSSNTVVARIPEIARLISDPDESLKVMHALTRLATEILTKD